MVCEETLDVAPDHPILRPGVVVSIRLDKNTRLSAVFHRYVEFCNESSNNKERKVVASDLEFAHCQLLNGSDTAEASALMKNDRIKVRKVRTAEREYEADQKRLQRESDRNFFLDMKHLMPDLGGSRTADIILDCQGKLLDESGRNQQVLSSTVKAHSVLLRKRCPWFEGIMLAARAKAQLHVQEPGSRDTPEEGSDNSRDSMRADIVCRVESDVKQEEDEEDDGFAVVPSSKQNHDTEEDAQSSGAAQIECDDDEEEDARSRTVGDSGLKVPNRSRSNSPAIVPSEHPIAPNKELLHVVIPNHAPEAVKILLEYCYTNRVASLGHEAFVQACKTRPQKYAGPVSPFPISIGSRRWPKNGYPTVSFSVAMAGIALAEEAGLPRLSLMCEVAASQLVTHGNVTDALAQCTLQKGTTGNDLPRLREAAVAVVLRSGPIGVMELGRSLTFRHALQERRALLVPSIIQGVMEAVTSHEATRGVKRDHNDFEFHSFEDLDAQDKYRRDRERRVRRQKHGGNHAHYHPSLAMQGIYDELAGWGESSKSIKYAAKNLESFHTRSLVAFPPSHTRRPSAHS